MFGTLGGPEIFLILVIALIVFGPRKLPEIGKSMGRMLAEFRKASNDPLYLKQLALFDLQPRVIAGDEYHAYARAQFQRDAKMLQEIGFKPD